MISSVSLTLAALALLQGGDRFGYDFELLQPPAAGSSWAAGLSGTGITAGYYRGPAGPLIGCVWIDGVLQPIGGTVCQAVNQTGLVVGGENSGGFPHPFRYISQSGTFEYLQGLTSGPRGSAADVNSRGQIVGVSSATAGAYPQMGTVWDRKGVPTALGTLGGTKSYPASINDVGTIVGTSFLVDDVDPKPFVHPGLGAAGGMQRLRLLPGDSSGNANDVNEAGMIVGSSSGVGSTGIVKSTAVYWLDGEVRPLPVDPSKSSVAIAVNNRGDVIAEYAKPFLLVGGVQYPIASLAATPANWSFGNAADIDDAGRICGNGINKLGKPRGFLLTPKPANLNRDATLDRADAVLFAAAFARGDALADIDRDGSVNRADLAAFLESFRGD